MDRMSRNQWRFRGSMSTFKASHLQLVGVFEVLKCPSQAARNGTCELCLKTMDLFTGAYGSEVP